MIALLQMWRKAVQICMLCTILAMAIKTYVRSQVNISQFNSILVSPRQEEPNTNCSLYFDDRTGSLTLHSLNRE